MLQPCKNETSSVLRTDSSDRAVNMLFVRYKNHPVNPLALELDIYSLAHHLCTM
jgi:hypothetical protein